MLFGELVSKHRKARGLSEAELAASVGAEVTAVQAWEAGSEVPDDTELIAKLSDALSIELGLAAVAARTSAEQLARPGTPAPGPAAEPAESSSPTDEAEGPSRAAVEPEPETAEPKAADVPSDRPMIEEFETADRDRRADATPADEEADKQPAGDPAASVARPRPPSIDDPGARTLAGQPTEQVAVVQPAPRTSAVGAQAPQNPVDLQEPSYIEDPRQMTTYWVRWMLTGAGLIALFIILVWGTGELFSIIGEIWSEISEEAAN